MKVKLSIVGEFEVTERGLLLRGIELPEPKVTLRVIIPPLQLRKECFIYTKQHVGLSNPIEVKQEDDVYIIPLEAIAWRLLEEFLMEIPEKGIVIEVDSERGIFRLAAA